MPRALTSRRLDGLAWVHETPVLRAFEFDFRIRVMERALGAYLDECLASLHGPATSSAATYSIVDRPENARRRYALYFETEHLISTSSPDRAFSYLIWHINRQVTSSVTHHLAIHAAAAATGQRAVLLVAPQEAGKTTLVAGLVRAGMSYLTDELVVFDERTSTVSGYAKPLSIDDGSWTVLADLEPKVADAVRPWIGRQWHVHPAAMRSDAVIAEARPSLLLCPRYVRDAPTAATPITRARAVAAVAQNSFNFAHLGRNAFDAAVELVRTCECFELVVGDLHAAVQLVHQLLEKGSANVA